MKTTFYRQKPFPSDNLNICYSKEVTPIKDILIDHIQIKQDPSKCYNNSCFEMFTISSSY